jgi:adenylate kinase family enzyme
MITKPCTVVFFGKSGAGKGTQSELLLGHLQKHDPKTKAIFVETGQRFRDFKNGPSYTAARVKEVLAAGKLLPPFIPIWMWTNLLVEEYTGKEHLVFDGVSRQPEEAPVLDSAFEFYGREGTLVILLDVSDAEAKKRLLKRARYDDTEDKINERIGWFGTNVMPAVDYFSKSKNVRFAKINGEGAPEDIHQEIIKALGI